MRCGAPIALVVCGTLLVLMPQVHRSVIGVNAIYAEAIRRHPGPDSSGVAGSPNPALFLSSGLDRASIVIGGGSILAAAAIATINAARREPRP